MLRWRINSNSLIVLGGVSFFMLLVAVLPGVDLPDVAFHQGTAPVVAHARATAPQAAVGVAAALPTFKFAERPEPLLKHLASTVIPDRNFRRILFCSIRC
jgi:hypothetical protein